MPKRQRSKSPNRSADAGFLMNAVAAAALVATALGAALRRTPADEPAREAVPPAVPFAPTATAVHAGRDAEGVGDSATSSIGEPEGHVKRIVRRVDAYQQARPWLGFTLAVFKKFSQDKAGLLAALVAYFGFFSLFPLMLAFTSVIGFVIPDPADQQTFSDAAADQIPVVGDTIRNTAGQIEGSVLAIVIGLALALWSGLRIVDAMQNALNDVWDLPRVTRPKLVTRRVRGALMLVVIGGGLVGSVVATNLAAFLDGLPGGGKAAIWVGTATVSVLLYVVAFQLLTDAKLPSPDLWPGAIFGGLCWWALQTFGSAYIVRQQEAAGETFGQFASIIALMAFLFLAAQLSILGAEISAVKSRKLWPRSLVRGEFTEADIRAFEYLATSTQQDEHYVVRIEPVEQ